MSQTINLSAEALTLLKLHVERDDIRVDDSNRELARAGIMFPVSGFASGPESHYRFTKDGWERREEWLNAAGAPR